MDGPVDFLDSLDVILLDGGCPAVGAAALCRAILTRCAVRGENAGDLVVVSRARTRVVSHTVTEEQWRCLLVVCSGHGFPFSVWYARV
jgi:hypothetical protein